MKRIWMILIGILPLISFGQVVSGGTPPTVMKVVPRKSWDMQKELNKLLSALVDNLSVSKIGEKLVVVRGKVNHMDDKDKVKKIISSYPKGQIVDLINYEVASQVIGIDVMIVVTDQSNSDKFDADILTGDARYSGSFSTVDGSSSSLLSWTVVADLTKLKNWITSGKAHIVSKSALLIESGGTGSILIGGEIPYQYSTTEGTGINFKEYGTKIGVKPVLLKNGNIGLKELKVTLSKPDMSIPTPGGQIGYMKKELITNINVRPNYNVVIGGFNYKGKEQISNSGCMLGLIPAFSYNHRREDKLMWIVLTPKTFLRHPHLSPEDYMLKEKKQK